MFKKLLTEIKGLIPEDLTAYLALDLAQNLKASLYFLITYEKEEDLAKAEAFLNKIIAEAEERNLKVEAHLNIFQSKDSGIICCISGEGLAK